MRNLFASLFFGALVLTASGCSSGPSNEDKATSQVNVSVRKEFNETNFPTDGTVAGGKDPWGNDLTWDLEKSWNKYTLKVRCAGADGLPYTKDDIIATQPVKVTDEESASERFMRGISRGTMKGIKQGILEKVTGKDGTKDAKDNPKDKSPK